MKRTVLVIAAALMAVAMLASPVLAIGPGNAENNPHLQLVGVYIRLDLPSHIIQQWTTTDPPNRVIFKDARKFQMRNAEEIVVATPSQGYLVLQAEGWIYLSQNSFLNFLLFIGIPYALAVQSAAMFPQGLYNTGFQVPAGQ